MMHGTHNFKDQSVHSVKEINTVYCENRKKQINILYGQNAELLNVPAVVTCSEHGVSWLKWNKRVLC